MKINNLFIYSAFLLISTALLAGGQSPAFSGGSIVMSSQGGLCGGVTIVVNVKDPSIKAQAIKLESYKVKIPLIGSPQWGQAIGSTLIKVPLRQRYDWAGINAGDYYAIKCFVKTSEFQGGENMIDCEKVIELQDIKHNVGCVIGPAGPDADYSPLNMNKG